MLTQDPHIHPNPLQFKSLNRFIHLSYTTLVQVVLSKSTDAQTHTILKVLPRQ